MKRGNMMVNEIALVFMICACLIYPLSAFSFCMRSLSFPRPILEKSSFQRLWYDGRHVSTCITGPRHDTSGEKQKKNTYARIFFILFYTKAS